MDIYYGNMNNDYIFILIFFKMEFFLLVILWLMLVVFKDNSYIVFIFDI